MIKKSIDFNFFDQFRPFLIKFNHFQYFNWILIVNWSNFIDNWSNLIKNRSSLIKKRSTPYHTILTLTSESFYNPRPNLLESDFELSTIRFGDLNRLSLIATFVTSVIVVCVTEGKDGSENLLNEMCRHLWMPPSCLILYEVFHSNYRHAWVATLLYSTYSIIFLYQEFFNLCDSLPLLCAPPKRKL